MHWLYAPPDRWAPVAAFGHPKPPSPPPPQPIPDIQDPALLAEKRRTLEAASARSGLLSTMLTGDNNNSYGGNKLGIR